jgi:leucyl aminopeptidase
MDVTVESIELGKVKAGGIIVAFMEETLKGAAFASADQITAGTLKASVDSKEFSGKPASQVLLRNGSTRIVVSGLGKPEEFSLEVLRRAFGAAATTLRDVGCKEIALAVPQIAGHSPKYVSRACVEGALLSLYSFDRYKTQDATSPKREVLKLNVLSYPKEVAQVEEGVKLASAVSDGANFAREIANEPPNVATPEYVAAAARKLAADSKLKITVYGPEELKKMGANALLAVASGSVNPPRLLHLEYDGRPGGKGSTVAVVGKGITFDSGGISIKPAMNMDQMKFDKCGACAVLGVMKAASELKLPIKVIGIAALTDNMPSGSAYKPSDIIKTLSGKYIEILNTDAEGRVVLSDALAYANTFKPDCIIDLATLTGACVVALGDLASGLFSNDEKLSEKVRMAGEISGERVWPLPLWPEYDELVKSDVADVKNIGSPGSAGPASGASFLKAFVGTTPWVHLDIAGTAWNTKPKPYLGLGANGMGVRLVTQFLLDSCKAG